MFLKNYTELIFLIVLFLPGYVSIRVLDAFMPYRERAFPRTLFDALTYSVANLLFCSLFFGTWFLGVATHPPTLDSVAWATDVPEAPRTQMVAGRAGVLAQAGAEAQQQAEGGGAESIRVYTILDALRFVLVLFIIPAIYPVVYISVRTLLDGEKVWRRLHLGPLIPQGWDSLWSKRRHHLVLVRLQDDTYVAGYFGSKSDASQWPCARELFLEEVWLVDENMALTGPVEKSAGVFIDCSKVKTIELWEVEEDIAGTATEGDSLESDEDALTMGDGSDGE